MSNIPKSMKIFIILFTFFGISILSYFLTKDNSNLFELNNGYTIDLNDYEFSKSLDLEKYMSEDGHDLDTLNKNIINSKNLNYISGVSDNMISSEDFNNIIQGKYKDLVICIIPYGLDIDFKDLKYDLDSTKTNIFFVEEVNTEMASNLEEFYINKKYPIEKNPFGGTSLIGDDKIPYIFHVVNDSVEKESSNFSVKELKKYL